MDHGDQEPACRTGMEWMGARVTLGEADDTPWTIFAAVDPLWDVCVCSGVSAYSNSMIDGKVLLTLAKYK